MMVIALAAGLIFIGLLAKEQMDYDGGGLKMWAVIAVIIMAAVWALAVYSPITE